MHDTPLRLSDLDGPEIDSHDEDDDDHRLLLDKSKPKDHITFQDDLRPPPPHPPNNGTTNHPPNHPNPPSYTTTTSTALTTRPQLPPPTLPLKKSLDKEAQRELYMIKTRAEASYLFKYLILTQIVVYLEAGAIPCLLDQLSVDLNMNVTQQGTLGGIVYLALSAASPLCAYMLQHHNPQHVLGASLVLNNLATLIFALTPTGYAFSANLIIVARGLIGFTQAFPCVYTPLWVDEYAPAEKAAGWMSFLQGSVPVGVMVGYTIGTVSGWIVPESLKWFQCWRWPFIVQFVLMLPIMCAVFFVPRKHLAIRCDSDKTPSGSDGSCSSPGSGSTEPATEENPSNETVDAIVNRISRGRRPSDVDKHDMDQHYMDSDSEDELDRDRANSTMPPEIPLRETRLSRNSLQHRSSRFSRSHVNDPNGFIGYLEEAVLLSSSTPMSWSAGGRHDDDDYLLTSATMYGSQRGFTRHFSRTMFHVDGESGPLSSRRSMRGSWRDVESPEVHPSPNLAGMSGVFRRGGRSLSPSAAVRTTPMNYGTLDNPAPRSPDASMLDASIFEEDFMEAYESASFGDAIKELIHIPIFYMIVLGLTAVYFVVTGVQYWSTIFMIKSLHASKYIVNSLFVIITGTGPIMGVLFGGWIVDRYGGYVGIQQRATALGICMTLGAAAFTIAAITTFFNDIYAVALLLWFLLFTGGSILPACTGIFISVVPARHRAVASSFSVMIFNLLGYALSPYLTGLVMQHILTHEDDPHHIFDQCDEACGYRLGFRFCLFWSVWSVFGIGGAFLHARLEARAQREATLEALESIPCVVVEEAA